MSDEPKGPGDGSPEDTVEVGVLAQGAPDYLGELERVVSDAGVDCKIIPEPDCDTGCAPRLLLVTRVDDVPAARAAIEAHWNKDLTDDQLAAVDTIVDLDADEATCPACGTPFPADAARCPECGLNFGD